MIEVIEKIGNIENLSLKNEEMEVVVSTFGCTIIKMIVEDKNGVKGDVVLGYDDFNQYQTLDGYLGALVGRVANRIGKGTFELNGETYHLPINNGPNSLHGGIKGFSYQIFDYEILDDYTIKFTYHAKDGEEGYPGNMDFSATYHLEGTPFDFRIPAKIGERVEVDHPQLKLGNGFDHHFFFTTDKNQVVLEDEESGRRLTVSTTLPGAQIYTANYLDGRIGKNGEPYNARDAVCIETQNLPDAIHIEKNPSTILRKGETFDAQTSYCLEVIK